MNLPTHFYLNRHKWTVEIVEDAADMEKCHGFCDAKHHTIEIWGGLGPIKQLRVFIHETLHAIEHEYNIKIPHVLIYKLEVPLANMVLLLLKYNNGGATECPKDHSTQTS